jgi:hypothetical protein
MEGNGVQDKIQKLDEQVAKRLDAIRELDEERQKFENERVELINQQSDLLADIIFKDIDRAIKAYLSLQEGFKKVKEKVAVLAGKDPAWHTKAEEKGLHPLFTTIGERFLKTADLPTLSLATFLSNVTEFDNAFGDKKNYDLERGL